MCGRVPCPERRCRRYPTGFLDQGGGLRLNSMVGFDRYDRRARLYHGMLAMLPVLFFFLILKPDAASGGISRSAISLLVFAGGFYFLANIARSAGKKIEPKLLERWGGWPS